MAHYNIVIKKTLILNHMRYQEGDNIIFSVNSVEYHGMLKEIDEKAGYIVVALEKPTREKKVFKLLEIDDTDHLWFD